MPGNLDGKFLAKIHHSFNHYIQSLKFFAIVFFAISKICKCLQEIPSQINSSLQHSRISKAFRIFSDCLELEYNAMSYQQQSVQL